MARALFDGIAYQIREQRGLHPITSLLTSSTCGSPEMGALALQILCKHSSLTSRLLLREGGVQPLISLLHSASPARRQHAALAIQSYCYRKGAFLFAPGRLGNFDPSQELKRLGAVQPMCQLLQSDAAKALAKQQPFQSLHVLCMAIILRMKCLQPHWQSMVQWSQLLHHSTPLHPFVRAQLRTRLWRYTTWIEAWHNRFWLWMAASSL